MQHRLGYTRDMTCHSPGPFHQSKGPQVFEIHPCCSAGITADRARARSDPNSPAVSLLSRACPSKMEKPPSEQVTSLDDVTR